MATLQFPLRAQPRQVLMRGLRDERALLTFVLMLSSGFALSLLAARVLRSGGWDYRFLVWNLCLAWMPFWLAIAMEVLDRRQARRVTLLATGAAWLLFFPNAPYIVTDFVHLHERSAVPLWYDILLLTAFAWNGLLLGFASLHICHRIVARRAGAAGGWLLVVATLFLAGFGIYLGRFERFNSWDSLTSPLSLLSSIAGRIADPLSHPRTWGVTLVIGGFLFLAYATLLSLTRSATEREDDDR
jgi:uncharacterized membrane protein